MKNPRIKGEVIMKLKKLLASAVAAALALTTMVTTSFTSASAAASDYVTLTINMPYFGNEVAISNTGDFIVNKTPLSVTDWGSFARQSDEVDTEYAGAFGSGKVDGCEGSVTMDVSLTGGELNLKYTSVWVNDLSACIISEFSIDLTKSVNGVLDVKIVNSGNPSDVQEGWYRNQNVTVNYLTTSAAIPSGAVTGSKTMVESNQWWSEVSVTSKEALIGDLDPATTTIEFSGINLTQVSLNTISSGWDDKSVKNGKIKIDASDIDFDNFSEGVKFGGSKPTEVKWVAASTSSTDVPKGEYNVVVESEVSHAKIGDKFNVTAKVTDSEGAPVTTGAVRWSNAPNWTSIPGDTDLDSNGTATKEFTIAGEAEAGKKVTIKATYEGVVGSVDITIDADGSSTGTDTTEAVTIWSGSQVISWDEGNNVIIEPAEFVNANVEAGGKLKFTFTPGADAQLKLSFNIEGWPVLASPKAASGYNAQYDVLPLSSSPFELTLAADDISGLKTNQLVVYGQDYTLTKVEYIAAGTSSQTPEQTPEQTPDETPEQTPSGGGVTGGTTTGGTTIAPSKETTSAGAVEDIVKASDGDNVKIDLKKGVTKLDKVVFDAFAGKDVTVHVSLPGGAYWEINGEDVTDAKDVDLGVYLNTGDIPEEKIDEIAGDNDSMQFSLSHNGDFGFTGVLNIPVSSKYNGQYANLYYYNRSRELEFVGSSQVSGGKVGFAFSHASDYIIVFDTFPYGDDVSSAAAASETGTAQAAPYVGILMLTVLVGASALIIRKRLAK